MPADPNSQRTMLVRAMYISAAVTVVIAIVLGATVAPALYAIALVALVDLGLALGVRERPAQAHRRPSARATGGGRCRGRPGRPLV